MKTPIFILKTSDFIGRSVNKLSIILSEPTGWFTALGLSFVVSLKDAFAIFLGALGIVFIDAFLGVIVSIKKGSYFSSYLARETVWKVILYMSFLLAVHIIEWIVSDDSFIGMKACFVIISLIELISICANGAIIKPNFPFFKLIQKYLSSEIARKLGINESDVEEVLKSKDYKNLKSDREKLHEETLKNQEQ